MLWVKPKFTTFTDGYRKIRMTMGDSSEDWVCFKCDRKFILNDIIGLACFKEVGNKILCYDCAVELDNKNVNGKFGRDKK